MAALAVASIASAAVAAEISDVMKAAMKGDASLYKKVSTGKGTEADAQKLAACLKGLEGTTPPKGDEAAWKRKVEALIKAAEDVAKGNKQAVSALQRSGNCKACHSAHKED